MTPEVSWGFSFEKVLSQKEDGFSAPFPISGTTAGVRESDDQDFVAFDAVNNPIRVSPQKFAAMTQRARFDFFGANETAFTSKASGS